MYGFGGKGTFPVGKIELPLSFGVAPNARSEQVTFDIVDMVYPYNAIMGRGSINKFEAAIHGLYLCMKIPGPLGVITVYGNQQTARNIEPVGKIELPLSFGVAPNARSEQITFDIVDMVYPYNAIMGRGSINKFEAAIHGLYLCMKIPGPLGVITVFGNQQTARNIERDFVPGQRNVHCLTAQREVPAPASPTDKQHNKAQLQSNDGTKTVPLDQATPKQFGVAPNARSEQITFDIVDMVYPYNAIMGRGSINKFEAAIHGLYLCMKIPGPLGVITVFGNQQTARNIERDFVPGQRNVHCLTAQREVPAPASPTDKQHNKAQLQSNDGTKTVPLDQATPKQTVTISEDLTSHEEEKLLCCLSKNKDVFAWSALDLVGVSRSIIEHGLGIDPSVRPKKQRLRKMSDEKTEATKAEVHRLLEAKFIEPVAYPTWLSNVVMVQKKSGKWRMCIDFTSLNSRMRGHVTPRLLLRLSPDIHEGGRQG